MMTRYVATLLFCLLISIYVGIAYWASTRLANRVARSKFVPTNGLDSIFLKVYDQVRILSFMIISDFALIISAMALTSKYIVALGLFVSVALNIAQLRNQKMDPSRSSLICVGLQILNVVVTGVIPMSAGLSKYFI